VDEAAVINLYTREWARKEESLYFILNSVLRNPNRTGIEPFFGYLRLFFEAIGKLKPCTASLYRGIVGNQNLSFIIDQKIRWWAFSSTTISLSSVTGFTKSSPIIFSIKSNRGYDISQFSSYKNEKEVLIIPPVQFKVTGVGTIDGVATIVDIEQDDSFPIQYFKINSSTNSSSNISQVLSNDKTYREFLKGMEYYSKTNYLDALRCFEQCSKDNYPPSFLMLGFIYSFSGLIGPKDETKKEYWYSLAKKYSDYFIGDQKDLYLVFCNGFYFQEVLNNHKEACKYYEISGNQGNLLAQNNLGNCYYHGKGVTKDFNQAVKYFLMSADQGCSLAQNNLGYCYLEGNGVTKDFNQAVKYFLMSADQGCSLAQYNLGYCYLEGEGVTKDFNQAVKYFQMSADQGCSLAQYSLAECYFEGKGVTKDITQARKFAKLSTDQGNELAQKLLRKIL